MKTHSLRYFYNSEAPKNRNYFYWTWMEPEDRVELFLKDGRRIFEPIARPIERKEHWIEIPAAEAVLMR